MSRRLVFACLPWVLVACGDNGGVAPDAALDLCAPELPPLPATGPLADPLALPLPADCVVGGLKDLPGRWYMRAPDLLFAFEYPLYEGTCEAGFRRASWYREDHDDGDGVTFHTWSDGTRIFYRRHFRFQFPEGTFEYATAHVACMLPDGTLAGLNAIHDSDRGEQLIPVVGSRLEPRDTGASGLELVGALAGDLVGLQVAVDGNHAYVAGYHGLAVIDVSDPTAPVQVGSVDGQFNDVKIVRANDQVVVYASPIQNQRTAIIDVTTPSAPRHVGYIDEYSHSVFVTPGPSPRLYLATYTETIPVYDVSNPLVPVRLGGIPVPGTGPEAGIHDIHIAGDRVYAMKTTDGLVALEVTGELDEPTRLGGHPTSYSHAGWDGTVGGRRVFIHGDEGMTGTPDGGAFMRVLDADPSSPTFMQELSRFQTRKEIGIHNMQLVGDLVYIAYYQDGVRIVDLSDPTQPREVAHFNTWEQDAPGEAFEGAVGISVVDDLIYVADFNRGLFILRETR